MTSPAASAQPRWLHPWGVTAAAVLLGLSTAWAASGLSGSLHLEVSAAHGVVVVGLVAAVVAILRRPVLGLVALVALVYLHASDVLVLRYGLPSILQLLVVPLALLALAEWQEDLLRGLSPWVLTMALAAYVLVLLTSTTAAIEPALADARTFDAGKGFVLFALVLLLCTTPSRVRAGAWTLVGAGFLLGGLGLVQLAVGEFESSFGGFASVETAQVYGDVMQPRLSGPLGDPNFFAQILVMVVPLGLFLAWKERDRRLRVAALVAAVVAAGAALATYSRGGAVALGVILLLSLVLARLDRRRLVGLGAFVLLGGALLLPGDVARRLGTLRQIVPGQVQVEQLDSSFQNRILQARVAWRMFLDHPIRGVGAGNYTRHYTEYADEIGSTAPEYYRDGGGHYPHNLYLELAAETGFPGVIVFGGVILLVFGGLGRARAAYGTAGRELPEALASGLLVALTGFLVTSLFLHGHYQDYLWVLFGLSAALIREAPTTGAGPSESTGGPGS